MSRPVVILVPAYRCEATIEETLKSIQQQGAALKRVEAVVIADDGSRDRTAEVARAVWHSAIPLRILERQFNCGEYSNVNRAVEEFPPEVEWFLIMHADNIAKPGWLSAFLSRIDAAGDDVALIGSSYDCFAESRPVRPGENGRIDQLVTVVGSQATMAGTLRMGCWWHISSSAIRISAFISVGGLPKAMQLKGDWDFLLRILADGWSIEHMPASLMLYRDNPSGSSSITFRRHMDIWEAMTVIGRYHRVLSQRSLASIHARHMWHITRRVVRAALRFDLPRALWAFPAFGCIFASYCSCGFHRGSRAEIRSRRLEAAKITSAPVAATALNPSQASDPTPHIAS